MKPTAASKHFPFPEHRTLAQVDTDRILALDGRWINGFWPHLKTRKEPEGKWVPSRFNENRGEWQCQSSRSEKWYVASGTWPTKMRWLKERPHWLVDV